jgi:acylphosphatase
MSASALVVVRGLVQGVGYRYFVLRQAEQLGISGYARNLPNGDVEVLAEGKREDVEALLRALRKGPRAAVVQDLTVEWRAQPSGRSGFAVF